MILDDDNAAVDPVSGVEGAQRQIQLSEALGEDGREEPSKGPGCGAPLAPHVHPPIRSAFVELHNRLCQESRIEAVAFQIDHSVE